jgi:hypothetical protein
VRTLGSVLVDRGDDALRQRQRPQAVIAGYRWILFAGRHIAERLQFQVQRIRFRRLKETPEEAQG